MKRLFILALFLLVPVAALGQGPSNPNIIPVVAAPSSCPGALPLWIISPGNAGAGTLYGNTSASTGTSCSALTSGGTPGTVTTVSVTTANGVSGSVANPTTTPAITLTLGAITPSSDAPANLTPNEPAYPNASNVLTSSPAYQDAATQTGSDGAAKVAAAIEAAYGVSAIAATIDARGLAAGNWSTCPLDTAAAASKLPNSGRIILPPGSTTWLNGPCMADGWQFVSDWPNGSNGTNYGDVVPAVGATIVQGASFPTVYTTGTVTPGTAGYNEVITGVSTAWADNAAGGGNVAAHSIFVCPAGGNTANMTYGYIKAGSISATSLTLEYGVHTGNAGAGCPGGSTYDIIPVTVPVGGGYSFTESGGNNYGTGLINVGVDCANHTNGWGVANLFGQQGTVLQNVNVNNCNGLGIGLFGNFVQHSGPYVNLTIHPGTGCAAGTVSLDVSTTSALYAIEGVSINKGTCSTTPTNEVVLEGAASLGYPDLEQANVGVLVNAGQAILPATPYPGPYQKSAANGIVIYGANGNGTTLIDLATSNGASKSVILQDTESGGYTNALIDAGNSCTVTSSSVNNNLIMYMLDSAGNIASSTATTSACQASPILKAPALGTPASGVITNLTGTCTSCAASNVPASGLTGSTLAAGVTASSLTSAAGGSFGTAAYQNTGTSGANLGFLNGANTLTGVQTFGLASYTAGVANSPAVTICGSYQNSGTPTFASDCWTITDVVGTGTNGTTSLSFAHAGSAPAANAINIKFPGNNAFIDSTGDGDFRNGYINALNYKSASNCSSSASPAVCGSAAAGSAALPTNAVSSSIVVNTTAVTANSQIFVMTDDTLGTKLSVTCNSTVATLVGGLTISARTAGTSFTVANNVAVVTNPLCVSWFIVN